MGAFFGIIRKGFQFIRKGVDKITEFVVSILNMVLLMIIYIVGIGLVSIILKMTGKHLYPLHKKSATYWINKEKKDLTKKDFYRQY